MSSSPGYTVEVRSDPSNVAQTYHQIDLHTDLTYYDYMAGVSCFEQVMIYGMSKGKNTCYVSFKGIFLHCIKQHSGPGGETILVDGFKACQVSDSGFKTFEVICR